MSASDRDGPRVVIVGGGISGLATAFRVREALPGASLTVLEKQPDAGGIARSDAVDGYVVDRGPNGFLTNVPESVELARALGLEDDLAPATDAARHRMLYQRGELRSLPTGPAAFLTTGLLSPVAKARVALEPFVRRAPPDVDETVHRFAQRRLGRAFADAFIAPMVLGITAGDARLTSVGALFPRLKRLEDEHGGLFRGMLARQREARAQPDSAGGPAGPGGRLTTFRGGGIERLIDALRDDLGSIVRTGHEVTRIVADAGGDGDSDGARYRVELDVGDVVAADVLIVATPAFVAAKLLADVLPEAKDDLEAIPYAGVRVLGLGYAREHVPRPLDGFGFLVPRGQGVRILGCLWTSTLFPWQAPEGKALLRVIAGGVPDPEFVQLNDDEALAVVQRDLETTMGITAEPEMVHHVRWEKAIPQYWQGHRERVARIMAAAGARPGLLLTGNAYYGIGVNDCARDANRVAEAVSASA
ncbi:MAG: protoporphyrinogen oxidase [Trueperaceae bacterium]|nr:protoporphyrinogen oxidase [Trueperaceae bacterium]